MVGLNSSRGAVPRRVAFYNVGVQGPLGQEVGLTQPGGGFFEHPDELFSDNLALGLRVYYPGQAVQEPVGCIHVSQVEAQAALECGLDSFRFFQPQQPVVHKNAGQLFAHGPVEKGGRDGGVHPAGEGADNSSVSHLLTDTGYGNRPPRCPASRRRRNRRRETGNSPGSTGPEACD